MNKINPLKTPLKAKSSLDNMRARFDADVERFSNLETGQSATVDAPLSMELITRAAVSITPSISRCLDIGCGAGNNTLKLLEMVEGKCDSDLCDLSAPMLERARERVATLDRGEVRVFHDDFRSVTIESGTYDVILAAAVLHHLREDHDWEAVFAKMYRVLRPGGSVWITDLVLHENEQVDAMMWQRYADYLVSLKGEEYQREVFAYIDKEDSPRPVTFQLDLLRKVGFRSVDLLHKNGCFAAFGAVK